MNTVKLGDDFEDISFAIIERAIRNNELGLIPKFCKVFRKKGYYSFRRKKKITFDLAVEVTPPKANNPTLLYLIECKNYSHPVPVDDISVFADYISQIEGYATKGIFITNNKLQSGALETLKSYGMMLIEVDDMSYNIVLHKTDKLKNQGTKDSELDNKIKETIENALLPKKVEGLKRFSAAQIQNIANNFLDKFDREILANALCLDLDKLVPYLNNTYKITVEHVYLEDNQGRTLLGYFNSEDNKILIDNSVVGTERYAFTLAHEIGHFVLHRNLKMNQVVYNNFKDSQHNVFTQQYEIKNDKNWIEWQANCFAANLLMPHISIVARLIEIQNKIGVSRNQGTIYVDQQIDNRKDFYTYIDQLSEHFKTSKQSLQNRLESLGILKYPKDIQTNYHEEQERIREESIRRANEYMNRQY